MDDDPVVGSKRSRRPSSRLADVVLFDDMDDDDVPNDTVRRVSSRGQGPAAAAQDGQPRLTQRRSGATKQSSINRFLQPTPEGQEGSKAQGNGTAAAASGPPGPGAEDHNLPPRHDGPFSQRIFTLAPFSAPSPSSGPTSSTGMPPLQSAASDPANLAPLSTPAAVKSAAQPVGTANGQPGSLVAAGSGQGPALGLTKTPATAGPAAPVADGAPEIEFPATTQRLLGWILDALVREGDTNDKVPMLARNKARKLRGGAHSAVQPLYIGFEEARLRLSVGHYPSIQELYRELESHCAACWVSLEEANQDNPVFDTILRTHLKDMAQQYATEVISLCEEVAESRMGRAARRTDTGAGDTGPRAPRSSRKVVVDEGPPMPPLPGAGQSLPYSVRTNMEPYYQGTWRREPFPPRAYTSLTEYALDGCTPEEHALLRARLATQRPDGASEHFRTEHAAQLGDAMPALERQLAAAVHQRATLTLGVDVMETDAWGIDMYTRRNIFNAVYESGLFNQPCPAQAIAGPPSTTPQPTTAPAAQPAPEANPLQDPQTELKEETVKLEDAKSDHPPTLPQPTQPPPQPATDSANPAQQPPSSPPPAPGPQLDPSAAAALLPPSQLPAAPGTNPAATAPARSPNGCSGPLSPQVRARMAALDRCGWGPGPEPVPGPQFESKPQLSGPLGQANGPSKELAGQGSERKGHPTDSQKGDEETAAGQGSDPDVAAAVHSWIDSKLLPAINHTGLQGYNMLAVCDTVRQEAAASGDPRSAGCADALEARLRQCGWPYFRVHPKGRGIQCTRPGGIRAFTLVEEYLGELHSPWRWWEVQDALRKATGQEDLPDFYNITLERPKDDPAGYDVLYVEAAFKATFASRMSHSCTPNCQAVVVSAGGRLTIAMYALRDIQEGEEMTFDYSSVTESEKEFRSAICLCGTQSCRGSYLHFLGAKAFGLFLETDHTLLHRQSIILRACMEPLTDADRARLKEHGLGTMALTHGLAGAPPCPEWLHKWASLMLEYVELERHMLPKLMLGLPPPFNQYTQEYAQAQAQGVMSSRITSILVALDKVKLFLRQPSQCQAPPLRLLTDAETIHHLWTGDRSFIKRTVTAAAPYLISGPLLASIGGLCAPDGLCGTEDMQRTLMALSRIPSGSTSSLAALLTLAASEVQSLLDVRSQLLQVEQLLRSCEDGTGMHTAAADIIHMTACTVVWFTAERNYKGFSSPPVVLHEEMLKMHKVLSSGTSNGNAGGGRPGGAQEDCAEGGEDAEGEETGLPSRHTMPPRRRSELPKGDSGTLVKRYGPWFMWSQLSTWYKQTVADPSATLSAERRGTLSLPDIECCYAVRGAQRYTPRERSTLLDHIERKPDIQWKTSTLWTFRNDAKVYGSPMLDSVYLPTVQGTPSNLSSVVERLRSVPYGGGAGGEPQRHGPGRPRKDSRDQLMLNK